MSPKSVAQIAQAIKVSRPAVSQGLKILLKARLVKFEIVGRKVFYSLDLDGCLLSARNLKASRS
jgi:DNA-binding transcriptional ArsR family regulator